jgi:hypothetical protein
MNELSLSAHWTNYMLSSLSTTTPAGVSCSPASWKRVCDAWSAPRFAAIRCLRRFDPSVRMSSTLLALLTLTCSNRNTRRGGEGRWRVHVNIVQEAQLIVAQGSWP